MAGSLEKWGLPVREGFCLSRATPCRAYWSQALGPFVCHRHKGRGNTREYVVRSERCGRSVGAEIMTRGALTRGRNKGNLRGRKDEGWVSDEMRGDTSKVLE